MRFVVPIRQATYREFPITLAAQPELRQKVLMPIGHIKTKLPGRWDFISLDLGAKAAHLNYVKVFLHFNFSRFQ